MERLKKKWYGVPVWVIALALIATVSAAGVYVFSNTVTVNVLQKPVPPAYTLDLITAGAVYINEPITFTGSLMADGTPVIGASIDILDMSSAQVISTATTSASGTFLCTYIPTVAGTYQFRARYLAP